MTIGDMMYENRFRVTLRLIGTVYENAIELIFKHVNSIGVSSLFLQSTDL
jgi:hypothetical protein